MLPTSTRSGRCAGRNILRQIFFYNLSQSRPNHVRGLIRKLTAKQLPDDFDIDTHFNPP